MWLRIHGRLNSIEENYTYDRKRISTWIESIEIVKWIEDNHLKDDTGHDWWIINEEALKLTI